MNFWWVLTVLLIVLATMPVLTGIARWYIRQKRCRSPAIKGLLDHYQEKLARKEEHPHTYRITLFKEDRHWVFWKRLKIFTRSGHRTLGSRTKFRIDPNKEAPNEGIAGRCWYGEKTIVRWSLPDVSGPEAGPDETVAYAEATFYDHKKVRKRHPKSRSLAGFPILINGKPWGCVVFDSENPKAIDDKIGDKKIVRDFLQIISKVLREMTNELEAS